VGSEFVIFENCTMKKKAATIIVMRDTTFSVHTIVSTWKFMNSLWHRKCVVWHTKKWP